MNRLGTWERKILRKIYGPVVEQGMWRIRSNQELSDLHNDLDIVADVEKERLEWIGHVVIMDQGGRVKKIFESKSPDLLTCDFFLWGYLKSRVYTHKHRTLNDLKEAIRQEIRPIDRQLLARIMDDFKKRLENYIQEDGRHLTDIIFKT